MLKTQICVTRPQCFNGYLFSLPRREVSHLHLASMLRMCAFLRLTPLFSFMVWAREHSVLLVNPSSCSKYDILNVARWVQRCTASHSIKSWLLIVVRISTLAELTLSYSLNVITFAGFQIKTFWHGVCYDALLFISRFLCTGRIIFLQKSDWTSIFSAAKIKKKYIFSV